MLHDQWPLETDFSRHFSTIDKDASGTVIFKDQVFETGEGSSCSIILSFSRFCPYHLYALWHDWDSLGFVSHWYCAGFEEKRRAKILAEETGYNAVSIKLSSTLHPWSCHCFICLLLLWRVCLLSAGFPAVSNSSDWSPSDWKNFIYGMLSVNLNIQMSLRSIVYFYVSYSQNLGSLQWIYIVQNSLYQSKSLAVEAHSFQFVPSQCSDEPPGCSFSDVQNIFIALKSLLMWVPWFVSY